MVPVVLIALPLYARYTLYPARSLELAPADTLDLHRMVSSFWCQGQRVSSNGTFDAFLLPTTPKLNPRRRRTTKASSILHITEEVPQARRVHLLKGSKVTLGVCSRWPGATLIVVQGAENFKRCFYEEDRDWDDVVEREQMNKEALTNMKLAKNSGIKNKGLVPIGNIDKFVNDGEGEGEGDAREVFDDSEDEIPTFVHGSLNRDENRIVHLDSLAREDLETTTIKLLKHQSSSGGNPTLSTQRYSTSTPSESSTTHPATGSLQVQMDSTTQKMLSTVKRKVLRTRQGFEATTVRHKTPTPSHGSKNVDDHNIEDNDVEDEKNDKKNNSRILRVLRSIVGRADLDDGPDEKRKQEEDEARKLGQLHSVNDTRDVTAGNSSHSSSEEFMQNCKSTIVMLNVQSLVDCQAQDLEQSPKIRVTINQTGDYYFIFQSDNSLEENVMKYFLVLDRVTYNVTGPSEACNNSTECSLPLRFLSSEAVVVEMANEPTTQTGDEVLPGLSSYEMQAVCQPRVAVYLVFILMVPFIILLFAFQ